MKVDRLDLSENELAIVREILEQLVPEREVWAFGSRVQGRARKFSDLDLAIIGNEPLPIETKADLADAFTESDLPYKVDVLDWATTLQEFRKIIEQGYIPLK